MEEESWRRNRGGGVMEEESWMRSHGRGIIEDSWKRNHGGGIMEKESWKRNHGDVGIIKEKSWRRNHVEFVRGGTIEEESSESHLGAIWKASTVGFPPKPKHIQSSSFATQDETETATENGLKRIHPCIVHCVLGALYCV